MDCKKVEHHLSDYYFQELSSENKEIIQQHLAACNNCQTLFNKFSAVMNAANLKEEIYAPDFIETRILAKLDNEKHQTSPIKVLQYFVRPVLVVSLAVLGIWVGVKISNTYINTTSEVNLASDNSNEQLSTQFANENYLSSTSDEIIEMYINNKQE